MPDLDDQIEDMEPSTMSQDDVQQPADKAAESTPASSSDATGDTDDSLLSVVRDVVGESRKPDDQTASQAEGEEEGSGDEATAEGEEDFSDVPFVKHPRFRKVLAERRDFKARAESAEQDATRYRNVQQFMDQNGLEANEAADLLVIGGLIKTNPVEAWKRMKPTVQKLLVAAGEVLPPDLQDRVQKGELSSEAALEVSRSRATQQSMQVAQSFQDRRRQHEQQQSAATALMQAANDWEAERTKKDPNFAAKMPLLEREIAYLHRSEGVPNTPDGVREQLKRAYTEVNKAFKAPAPVQQQQPPQRPAVKPAITPVRGGEVAGGAKPEIKSTMDVLTNVMAKRRQSA